MYPDPTLTGEHTPDTGHCWTVGDLADWLAGQPRDAVVVLAHPDDTCDYAFPLVWALATVYSPLHESYGDAGGPVDNPAATSGDLRAVLLQPDPAEK